MATIGLAALTKKWVEDPVREARHFGLARSRTTFAYAAAAAALLTVACVVPREVVERDAERSVEVAQRLAHHEPPCFGAAAMAPQAKGCPNARPRRRDGAGSRRGGEGRSAVVDVLLAGLQGPARAVPVRQAQRDASRTWPSSVTRTPAC